MIIYFNSPITSASYTVCSPSNPSLSLTDLFSTLPLNSTTAMLTLPSIHEPSEKILISSYTSSVSFATCSFNASMLPCNLGSHLGPLLTGLMTS